MLQSLFIDQPRHLFIGHRYEAELRDVAFYDCAMAREIHVLTTESKAVLWAEAEGLVLHYADTYDA